MDVSGLASLTLTRSSAVQSPSSERPATSSVPSDGPDARTASSPTVGTGADGQSAASRGVLATTAGAYISPIVRYDQVAQLAVMVFRDSDTGETRDQLPPERVVEQYRRSGGRPDVFGAAQRVETQSPVVTEAGATLGAGGPAANAADTLSPSPPIGSTPRAGRPAGVSTDAGGSVTAAASGAVSASGAGVNASGPAPSAGSRVSLTV